MVTFGGRDLYAYASPFRSMSTLRLATDASDTIHEVTKTIQEKKGIPQHEQCLMLHGKQVMYGHKLSDFDIQIDMFISSCVKMLAAKHGTPFAKTPCDGWKTRSVATGRSQKCLLRSVTIGDQRNGSCFQNSGRRKRWMDPCTESRLHSKALN